MALKQTITVATGVDVTYWRISAISYNRGGDGIATVRVELLGYITEEARRLGCDPVYPVSFEYQTVDTPKIAEAYELAKSHMFSKAVDV